MPPAEGAAVLAAAASRRRLAKRALGLLRTASRLLAEATQDLDVVAELVDPSPAELAAVLEHARAGRAGPLHVVVLAVPPAAADRSQPALTTTAASVNGG